MKIATTYFFVAAMKHAATVGLAVLVLTLFRETSLQRQAILAQFSIQDIAERLKDSCVLVGTNPANSTTFQLLKNLSKIFRSEPRVIIGTLIEDRSYLTGKEGMNLKNKGISNSILDDLDFYPRKLGDRKCLLRPPVSSLRAQRYQGERTAISLLNFLNSKCGTHRRLDGSLSTAGNSIKSILDNVFHVQENQNGDDTRKFWSGTKGPVNVGPVCERITMPSKGEFLHNYLFRSRPVIITGALEKWPALQKWTNEFLISKYGKDEVRVAFAPNGEYEGCEKAANYEDYKNFKLPDEVKRQLPFPDLVVVRPAFINIKFKEFMNVLENKHKDLTKMSNISAYLEYTAIPSHFPELEKDIMEMPCAAGVLERKHLNIWLSDGSTLGKLHFDPFDNFLCQISGKKQVLLYEPHDNTRLYEAHIQEAMLGYNPTHKEFRRKKLLDSTSMVMSPINILKPDYDRFPKFRGLQAINCTINEGEVLFMPSFWWHEVLSYPSNKQPRNLAVNYWYEPFFTKEYPCKSCKLEVNPLYHKLLMS